MALSPLQINHPGIGQPPVPDLNVPISEEMVSKVLEELFNCGFMMHFVNICKVDSNLVYTPDGKTLARHTYIPSVGRVGLFFFTDNVEYMNLSVMWKPPGPPNLRMGVSVVGVPCLTILGDYATEDLHDFIVNELMIHIEDSIGYELTRNAGAVFIQGRQNPYGELFVIEFAHPENAQPFIDYINENFHYK